MTLLSPSPDLRQAAAAAVAITRVRLAVTGTVQGVGFRPFVHRLAARLGLVGFVFNDPRGVLIEVEGDLTAVDAFRSALRDQAPPLARIDRIDASAAPPLGVERAFEVRASGLGAAGARVPPDVGPCAACVAEALDPADRRHGYAFTTCTDCGPRLTILTALPYDRARTTMAGFPLCAACAAEYADPASRRFHAETIACPDCGPRLSHPVAEMARVLKDGGVVALKGLGGYHLACNAADAAAVDRLRARKGRDAKPFAVMVESLEQARQLAWLAAEEAALLESRERPIVVVDAPASRLAAGVSSGLPTLGLMLPSSLLHLLLLRETGRLGVPALVMTSGNLSGAPVIIDDGEAARSLAGVADLVVTHDRAIAVRADDSVVRLAAGAPVFIRRSRGSAPKAIRLAGRGPVVLALGGQLKATACVVSGDEAILSPHIGDLDHPEAALALETAVEQLLALTGARPAVIAHDLHPDFASTRLAESLAARFDVPTLAVQHHHAHIAAVAAEHGVGDCLGLALDGFGLGEDSENGETRAWGGELLCIKGGSSTRLGALAEMVEPGGDQAAREPWRMTAGLLAGLGRGEEIAARFADRPRAAALAALLARPGARLATTTSAGRLFDAVAGLLGVASVNRFEAEAAMRLEALVRTPRVLAGGYRIRFTDEGGARLDLTPLLSTLADLKDARLGAELLHGTLAEGLAELTAQVWRPGMPRTVALGGGCFLNRRLAEALVAALTGRDFTPLIARKAPPNDGGLALGQAAVARAGLLSAVGG